MSVSGKYEKYTCCTGGDKIKTQSIVECRLNDWSEKKILAVGAKAVLGGAEVLSGEIRYGGKLYFTIVAAEEDGAIIGAERGAEFSHKAPCESAAPAQTADVVLRVEKTEIRRDGRAVVLSAIVSAEIELFVPAEIDYLSGGEGIVCDFAPVRVLQVFTARGEAEIEEEFDTDYVGDVLMHSECAFVNRAVSVAGGVEVSGEINLGILAKKEGENDVVSFERLIPFRAEIPCDEAVTGAGATAVVEVRSVNISASCDEDCGICAGSARKSVSRRKRGHAERRLLPRLQERSRKEGDRIERADLLFLRFRTRFGYGRNVRPNRLFLLSASGRADRLRGRGGRGRRRSECRRGRVCHRFV